MNRYIRFSVIYAILALCGGVFYREFTRFNGFSARTSLGLVHAHYFLLGMIFFLLLLLLENSFPFMSVKTERILIVYHIGLNLSAIMLLLRGIFQVQGNNLTSSMNRAISVIVGIGHIMLGVSLVLILVQIKHSISKA